MMLPNYSRVRLLTDRFETEGVSIGDVGAIIEENDSHYLVEFSREDGTTIATITVDHDEVELAVS